MSSFNDKYKSSFWAHTLVNSLERLSLDLFQKNKTSINPNLVYLELHTQTEFIRTNTNPQQAHALVDCILEVLTKYPALFIKADSLTPRETATVCTFFILKTFSDLYTSPLTAEFSNYKSQFGDRLYFNVVVKRRRFLRYFYNLTEVLYSLELNNRTPLDIKKTQIQLLDKLIKLEVVNQWGVKNGSSGFRDVTFLQTTYLQFNIGLFYNVDLILSYPTQHPFQDLNQTYSVGNSVLSIRRKMNRIIPLSVGKPVTEVLRSLNSRRLVVCPAFSLIFKSTSFLKNLVECLDKKFLLDLSSFNLDELCLEQGSTSAYAEYLPYKVLERVYCVANESEQLKQYKKNEYDSLESHAALLKALFLDTSTEGELIYDPKTYDCWETWHSNMFEYAQIKKQLDLLLSEIKDLEIQQKTNFNLFRDDICLFVFLSYLPRIKFDFFFQHFCDSLGRIRSRSKFHPLRNRFAAITLIPGAGNFKSSLFWDDLKQTQYFRVIIDSGVRLDSFYRSDIFKTELDTFLAIQIFFEIGKTLRNFKCGSFYGTSLQDFVDAGIRACNHYITFGDFPDEGVRIDEQLRVLKLFMVLENFKKYNTWVEFSVLRSFDGSYYQHRAYVLQPNASKSLLYLDFVGNRWYNIYAIIFDLYLLERRTFLSKFSKNLVNFILQDSVFKRIVRAVNHGATRRQSYFLLRSILKRQFIYKNLSTDNIQDLFRIHNDLFQFLVYKVFVKLYKKGVHGNLDGFSGIVDISAHHLQLVKGRKQAYKLKKSKTIFNKRGFQGSVVRSLEAKLIQHNLTKVECFITRSDFLVNVRDVGSLMDETNSFFIQNGLACDTNDYALFILF